jgi:hypothetical protein
MKKPASKHSHSIKFNPQEYFTKNIGIVGLVVVFLLLVIYLLVKKVDTLEKKVTLMDTKVGNVETEVKDLNSKPVENMKK